MVYIKYINLLFFLMILSVSKISFALNNQGEKLFILANESYEQGDYNKAIKLYEEIIGIKKEDTALYFNLGNAYYRNNEIGKSIFFYKKALVLAPRNGDIKFNYTFAKRKVIDKVELKQSMMDRIRDDFPFSGRELIIIISLCTLIFWPIQLIILLGKKFDALYWIRNGLLSVILFAAVGAGLKIWSFKEFGVVVAKEARVHSSTGHDQVVLFTLHEGTEFHIQERRANGWVKIILGDGKKGWIDTKYIIM